MTILNVTVRHLLDTLSPEARSVRMRLVKSKDTGPELIVRKITHQMGFRYRLHVKSVPGKPDLVFAGRKKLIFVHGCFWHRHLGCSRARLPKTRQEFWLPKLEANRERDVVTMRRLKEEGWDVLVIWECEISSHDELRSRIKNFLQKSENLDEGG